MSMKRCFPFCGQQSLRSRSQRHVTCRCHGCLAQAGQSEQRCMIDPVPEKEGTVFLFILTPKMPAAHFQHRRPLRALGKRQPPVPPEERHGHTSSPARGISALAGHTHQPALLTPARIQHVASDMLHPSFRQRWWWRSALPAGQAISSEPSM